VDSHARTVGTAPRRVRRIAEDDAGPRIGFVFQRFNLIPTLNAVENVEDSWRDRGLTLTYVAESDPPEEGEDG